MRAPLTHRSLRTRADEPPMKWFARLVTGHPRLLLCALALLTLGAAHGIVDLRTGEMRIRIDPALDRLLPEQDVERRFYEKARRTFGSDEFILLVLEAPDVFSAEALRRIQRVTQRLEEAPDVRRVVSLANATEVIGYEDEIEIRPFFEEVPEDPAALATLRATIAAHPVYGGALVAPDGRAAAIAVFFEDIDGDDFVRRDVSGALAALAREAAGTTLQVTGAPHIKSRLSGTILAELGLILPLIGVIVALLCALAFRTWRGVALPLTSIVLALVWTLGAMGWAGAPLTLVSNIIPPLLLTLGFAAAMHVMSEYYVALLEQPADHAGANLDAVRRVLHEMGLAMLANGVTTLLGFLSLCTSTVLAIRQFGLWSVVGVVAATVSALVFLPAALVLLGAPRRRQAASRTGHLEAVAGRIADFDIRHRNAIFIGVAALLVAAMYGMSRIEVSSSFVGSFVAGSPVRTTFESLNARLGGLNSFFVVVEADEDQAFTQPENLRELASLQEWLEAQPEIGKTVSLADGIKVLNRAFSANAPEAAVIPSRAEHVRELLFFSGDALTEGFVDSTYRTANITVRTGISSSAEVRALMTRLEARLRQLPRRLHAQPTGDLVLLSHTMDSVTEGMLSSSFTAFFSIYLTLALLLTSFRVGLYALLPNLVPVACYYGALGFTGTPLNLSTSLIGAITLGIAVDDTVHYFARFALEARRLGNERLATISTLRAVIRPLSFTTVGLCLGFLALTASELRNQVEFGLLSAFTMAVGWLFELTLSPALCSRIRLITLWDVLSLDLGHDPTRSIPLFEGLSKRQARIFALMSTMVTLPAGRRLFAEGDHGGEMFVVIDGELVAGLARDDARVEFARMRRGDVVGEIALFQQLRSADVDVVQDARLLRFGEAELQRLRERYPRIAATVYANLNRVLAARIQNTISVLR